VTEEQLEALFVEAEANIEISVDLEKQAIISSAGEIAFEVEPFRRHGARFSAEIYTRGCHWIPRMFASIEHACDQWHSSRKFTLLPVDTVNCVQTLKALLTERV
jgi:hypothetical protein